MNKKQVALCKEYMPLAKDTALKLFRFYVRYNSKIDFADALQTANLALCKACVKFDEKSDLDFETFAVKWFIRPELTDFFYKSIVPVSVDFKRLINKAKNVIKNEPGTPLYDLAKILKIDEGMAGYICSIITGAGGVELPLQEVYTVDEIKKPDEITEKTEIRGRIIAEVKRILNPQEESYTVKKLMGYTPEDISNFFNVPVCEVYTVLKTARRKLRASDALRGLLYD